MKSVFSLRPGQAALAVALFAALWSMPPTSAEAFDLFARHEVTVQFATADGKPMADAEVKIFAPGKPDRPALIGRTDKTGKFEFPADRDGFWSAEAHTGSEVDRIMIRVGGAGSSKPPSPLWLIGGLVLLLILAVGYRVARARSRRRPG